MDRLGKLIKDSIDLIDSRGTIEQDREAIIAAMMVSKLDTASKRVSECDDLVININYQEADLAALSKVRTYANLLDSMISYNNIIYNRVIKLAIDDI